MPAITQSCSRCDVSVATRFVGDQTSCCMHGTDVGSGLDIEPGTRSLFVWHTTCVYPCQTDLNTTWAALSCQDGACSSSYQGSASLTETHGRPRGRHRVCGHSVAIGVECGLIGVLSVARRTLTTDRSPACGGEIRFHRCVQTQQLRCHTGQCRSRCWMSFSGFACVETLQATHAVVALEGKGVRLKAMLENESVPRPPSPGRGPRGVDTPCFAPALTRQSSMQETLMGRFQYRRACAACLVLFTLIADSGGHTYLQCATHLAAGLLVLSTFAVCTGT